MSAADVADRIRRQAERAGCDVAPDLAAALARYVALLARWDRTVNLTSLDLDPPTDPALDRLIVEPLVAARYVRPADRACVDIGSGGGSPAIPMKLAVPSLRLTMVETRARKAAFLREAIRQLALTDATVETRRFEEMAARPDMAGQVQLVTARAVRMDKRLAAGISNVLCRGGRLFWFCGVGDQPHAPSFQAVAEVALPGTARLLVFEADKSI